jgi:hypothetical protein
MGVLRRRPALYRDGKLAWLGPVSLGLALLSWVIPVLDIAIASIAVACGLVALFTSTDDRIDWTAVAGAIVGFLQVLLALMLVAIDVYGY